MSSDRPAKPQRRRRDLRATPTTRSGCIGSTCTIRQSRTHAANSPPNAYRSKNSPHRPIPLLPTIRRNTTSCRSLPGTPRHSIETATYPGAMSSSERPIVVSGGTPSSSKTSTTAIGGHARPLAPSEGVAMGHILNNQPFVHCRRGIVRGGVARRALR